MLNTMPTLTWAQRYIPPDRGLPGRREGGGTRGGCVTNQPTLTALIPDSNYGTTTAAYPTLFWFVPSNTATSVEFVLMDANDQELYKTTFQITGDAGVIHLSLPANANLPPLEIGQDYHWYFSVICDPTDRSGDVLTEGWIQRIEPDPALVTQLESTPVSNHPTLYAEAGIWYDAIASLATLRYAQPNSSALANQWETLLDSVGLADLANQPLVPCCQPTSANEP